MKNEAFRLGLTGALIGVSAPVLYTLVEMVLFHSDMTLSGYYRHAVFSQHEELVSYLFIAGAVVVMGAAGAAVGRLREDDARHRARIESANRELAALNSIADIIARTRDIEAVLYLVLKETLSLSFLNIESKGAVFVRDEDDPGMLRMAANVDLAPFLAQNEKRIRLGHCLCGKAAQTGETITSLDCFEDEDHTTNYPGMTRHGHVVVPITGRQGVLGVMTFYLPPESAPSRDDIRVLSAIANQLAVAIENASLSRSVTEAREDSQQKGVELAKNVEALKALVEVDRTILSTMDRDEMLFRVGVQIRQLVAADVGGVALRDADSGGYYFVGGWGLDASKGDMVLPSGWYVGPELKSGRPVLHGDFNGLDDPSPMDRLLMETGVRSGAYVPIVRKGRAAGIFFLGSLRLSGISKEDVETAVSFASRMGIALEHSRLIYSLEEMSVNIIHALASAIDAKSAWTKGHSERVADYAMGIAEKMGVGGNMQERLRLAGLLHDIGKIGTYDILLDKEGKLSEEELELIKQHPDRGCEILAPIKEFKDILPAVRHHHERWDGKGYPLGLKGEEIPLAARILCVADSFDTMTADRPYRPSIGLDNAVQELKYCSGAQFAPEVVAAFLEIINERGPAATKLKGRPYQPSIRLFDGLSDFRF